MLMNTQLAHSAMHRQSSEAKQRHAPSMYPDPEASAAQFYSSADGRQLGDSHGAAAYNQEFRAEPTDHDFLQETGGRLELFSLHER